MFAVYKNINYMSILLTIKWKILCKKRFVYKKVYAA